ncbi:cytochrome P450 9e2 [Nephila pilipes]|uniref:Cytochrome P450 9e2 n=1 Tax=Nephila pilipes TaxID=299642 RepID=A0A8X6MWE0_NEPPI|nr:cytochrome P450 9e2 [Nephila pilipes]
MNTCYKTEEKIDNPDSRYYSKVRVPWGDVNCPYPHRSFWYGTYKEMFEKPHHEVENERFETFKDSDVYANFVGTLPIITVCKPASLRKLKKCSTKPLFNMLNAVIQSTLEYFETSRWRKCKYKVKEKLSGENDIFEYSVDEVVDLAFQLVNRLWNIADFEDPIDVTMLFYDFAFEATFRTLLLMDYEVINDPEKKLTGKIQRVFRTGDKITKNLIFHSHFSRIARRFGHQMDHEELMSFRNDVYKLIRTNWLEDETSFYLLNSIRDAMKGTDYSDDSETTKREHLLDDMTNLCVYFLLFGSHKVSTLASMVCYLLAKHEDVQEYLRGRIQDAVEFDNGCLKYRSLDSIKDLETIIKETLRLYPPVSRIDRKADARIRVAGDRLEIPKDAFMSIPVCGIHRNSDVYIDPAGFDPSRFYRDSLSKYEFLPFGLGVRKCAGEAFGLMLTKILIIYIVGNFKIDLYPLNNEMPPKFRPSYQGLLQIEELPLYFSPLKDSPFKMREITMGS